MGALLLLDLASNNLGGLSDWMKPPREDLELGGLVDGNPVVEIHSDTMMKSKVYEKYIALCSKLNSQYRRMYLSDFQLLDKYQQSIA